MTETGFLWLIVFQYLLVPERFVALLDGLKNGRKKAKRVSGSVVDAQSAKFDGTIKLLSGHRIKVVGQLK